MKNIQMWSTICFAAVFLGSSSAAENENRTKPGEFIIDHPTLINLGFEWLIQGDDNRNAQVEVSYRKQGDTEWKRGLPLLRLQIEVLRFDQRLGEIDRVGHDAHVRQMVFVTDKMFD